MKVRITSKGVNVKNDKGIEEAAKVGTIIEVDGDEIPAWLKNKVEPVDGKLFVTGAAGGGAPEINPATGKPYTKKELEKLAKDQAAAERAEAVESAKLLGVEVTDKMTTEEIKAAIAAAGQS